MDRISFTESMSINIEQLNMLTANTHFYHVDRIAQMNVMIYVLSGCIYVSEGDVDYEVNKDEMLLLKKGTHQFGKRQIEPGTSWIYAHFTMKGGEEAGEVKFLPKYITLHGQRDVKDRLIKLCEQFESGRLFGKSRATIGFLELMFDIYEMENKNIKEDAENIRLYIEGNLFRSIKGRDLETEFNLSYKYMNRLFKAAYGKCIMQYHSDVRMEQAARMLRTTKKSIQQIGDELGFEDALYFSKCFKKYMNMSPRTYRKNIVNNF